MFSDFTTPLQLQSEFHILNVNINLKKFTLVEMHAFCLCNLITPDVVLVMGGDSVIL